MERSVNCRNGARCRLISRPRFRRLSAEPIHGQGGYVSIVNALRDLAQGDFPVEDAGWSTREIGSPPS